MSCAGSLQLVLRAENVCKQLLCSAQLHTSPMHWSALTCTRLRSQHHCSASFESLRTLILMALIGSVHGESTAVTNAGGLHSSGMGMSQKPGSPLISTGSVP